LSFASGQGDAVAEAHSPCVIPTASVDRDSHVVSSEIVGRCDDAQFLRNEAISPVVNAPSFAVGGEAGVTEKPGETVDAIRRAIAEGIKKDGGAGMEWSGFLRELQAGGDRDFRVDRAPPGAAGGV
jgi:hypothetical protein